MPERYESARHEAIAQEIGKSGRVSVATLAGALGVSEVTIRKDLDALERQSLLRRVRGGAVASSVGDEGAFSERLRHGAGTKRSIARRAADLVKDGDVIAIDSSTSCYFLAQELLERHDLIVVTYGMQAAMLLMEQSDATVIMPGGVLRRASGSMVGSFSNALEGRGRIGKGFFGVTALSPRLGLLELSSEEAEAKRSLVASCDAVYGLFDSSKITGFGLQSFVPAGALTGLITDGRAEDDFVSDWDAVGVPVTRVPAETGRRIAPDRR